MEDSKQPVRPFYVFSFIFFPVLFISLFIIILALLQTHLVINGVLIQQTNIRPITKTKEIFNKALFYGNSLSMISEKLLDNDNLVVGSISDLYCGLLNTQKSCYSKQDSSYQYQINKNYETSTTFGCLEGNCSSFDVLGQFLWTHKLSMSYFDYYTIKIENGSFISRIVVPNSNVTFNSSVNTSEWFIQYQNSQYILTKNTQKDNNSIQISLYLNYQKIYQLTNTRINYLTITNTNSSSSSSNAFKFNNQQLFRIQIPIDKEQQSYVLTISLITFFFFALTIIGCFYIYQSSTKWQIRNFQPFKILDSFYRFMLNQIFKGEKPSNSTIIFKGTTRDFFENMSYLFDKTYTKMTKSSNPLKKTQAFKFESTLERLKLKFQQYYKPIKQDQNKHLADFKYQIKTQISQISDDNTKKIKELHFKAREIRITQAFFKYAYASMLNNVDGFEKIVVKESFPIPSDFLKLFRVINHQVYSKDIKRSFSFLDHQTSELEEQILMRIQSSILQKYLFSVRQLDSGLKMAKQFKIDKQLENLNQKIENMKYLFITHFN